MSQESAPTPFATLSAVETRDNLRALLHPRSVDKDEYLFFEGDPADTLYLVRSGRIKVLKHSATGKEMVLEIVSAGDTVGETGILDGGAYPVSAQAMEPSQVWGIRRADYLRALDAHPDLALQTARSLGKRLQEAYQTMLSLAVERVERRIARVLLKLAAATGQRTNEGIVIGATVTRQDIADMTGTTVETAIRVMSRWTKRGLIRSRRGRITLLRPHELVLIAEEVQQG